MFENISFLYVEDDPNSRYVMQLILSKKMGVKNFWIFEDSHDFVSRLHALTPPPDIFLLDIHIDPHDGFEMLAMIRSVPHLKEAKVVALTASVMNEEVEALRTKGFDGTISKPLDLTTFPELMRQVVTGESVWHII